VAAENSQHKKKKRGVTNWAALLNLRRGEGKRRGRPRKKTRGGWGIGGSVGTKKKHRKRGGGVPPSKAAGGNKKKPELVQKRKKKPWKKTQVRRESLGRAPWEKGQARVGKSGDE